jgi:hypothetical protein
VCACRCRRWTTTRSASGEKYNLRRCVRTRYCGSNNFTDTRVNPTRVHTNKDLLRWPSTNFQATKTLNPSIPQLSEGLFQPTRSNKTVSYLKKKKKNGAWITMLPHIQTYPTCCIGGRIDNDYRCFPGLRCTTSTTNPPFRWVQVCSSPVFDVVVLSRNLLSSWASNQPSDRRIDPACTARRVGW